jgi:hypothetical protein
MVKAGDYRQPFLIYFLDFFQPVPALFDLGAHRTLRYTETMGVSLSFFQLMVLLQEAAAAICTEKCFNLSQNLLTSQSVPFLPGIIIFAFYC